MAFSDNSRRGSNSNSPLRRSSTSKKQRSGSTGGPNDSASNLNLNRARSTSNTPPEQQRRNSVNTTLTNTPPNPDTSATTLPDAVPQLQQRSSETQAIIRRQTSVRDATLANADPAATDTQATQGRRLSDPLANRTSTVDLLRSDSVIDPATEPATTSQQQRRASVEEVIRQERGLSLENRLARGRAQSVEGLSINQQRQAEEQQQAMIERREKLLAAFRKADELGDTMLVRLSVVDSAVEDVVSGNFTSNADIARRNETADIIITDAVPDVTVRSSTYNENQDEWPTLPAEATVALRSLVDSLVQLHGEPNALRATASNLAYVRMAEVSTNVFAKNGEQVSMETLNDLYHIAKDKLRLLRINPEPQNILTGPLANELEVKNRAQELVDVIDALGLDQLLSPDTADTYKAYEIEKASFIDRPDRASASAATDSPIRSPLVMPKLVSENEKITSTENIDDQPNLNVVSLVSRRNNPILDDTINEYRNRMREFLKGELAALKAVFGQKIVKKEHHYEVLDAEEMLRNAIDEFETTINADEATEGQLKDALGIMRIVANSYVTRTERSQRIPGRIKAAQNVVERIDMMAITDGQIFTVALQQAMNALTERRDQIVSVLDAGENPRAVENLDEFLENLFYNPSPSATAQSTLLDSVAIALDGVDKAGVGLGRGLRATAAGAGSISTALGLLGDAAAAVRYIRALKDEPGFSQVQAARGTLLATNNLGKNVPAAISAGIKVAEVMSVADAGLKAVGGTLSNVAVGTSVVVGTGYMLHGGLVLYKTNWQRGSNLPDIDDVQLREQIGDRISTKSQRAFWEALGATFGVVGGVLVITATGGLAAPVLAGLAGVIAIGLSADRARGALKDDPGRARNELADAVFVAMNDLLAEGKFDKARSLAKSLTNNPLKQSLMLRGADPFADEDAQVEAIQIMREKLKTW